MRERELDLLALLGESKGKGGTSVVPLCCVCLCAVYACVRMCRNYACARSCIVCTCVYMYVHFIFVTSFERKKNKERQPDRQTDRHRRINAYWNPDCFVFKSYCRSQRSTQRMKKNDSNKKNNNKIWPSESKEEKEQDEEKQGRRLG